MFLRLVPLVPALAALFALNLLAAEPAPVLRLFPSPSAQNAKTKNLWNTAELFATPKTFEVEAEGLTSRDGITPIFFEGVPFRGKPTRVFAWLGIPPGDGKVPGVVLVHGGGGTAYRAWVKLWMDRGYAAIAVDTSGAIPQTEEGMRVKAKPHAFAGPASKGSGFETTDQPVPDQWMYHAIAAVIKGHSLLRSQPRVDPDRIGITGISWGGVMTLIAASVDTRFKFAAPVYGCGFLGEDSHWLEKQFQEIKPEQAEEWIRLWDPSQYAFRIRIPTLFCNGTNDKFFRLDSWQKTYQLVPAPVTLSLRVRMTHGHPPAGDPPEIAAFADSVLKAGRALPAIGDQGRDGTTAWARYSSTQPVQSGRLIYTVDRGPWVSRNWQNSPVNLEPDRVSQTLPEGVTAYYFYLQDANKAMVSSPLQILSEN